MDGYGGLPPGIMPPMGAGGMMMPPGLMGMGDLPFAGAGAEDAMAWRRAQGGFPGQAGSSKESSVFYKTRLCQKFQEGSCTAGDRCNYAHGEAELRQLPPEGQQVLDTMGRGGRGGNAGPSPPAGVKKRRGSGGGARVGPGNLEPYGRQTSAEKAGVRSTAFKSRLCTRFMQKGDCSYGATCHFAHGYDDLQTPDKTPASGPQVDAGQMEAMRRAGMMMPGAGMMPQEMMAMAAMGGMPGGMMPPGPRPPPGPPPGAPPSEYQASPDQQGYAFDMSRTPTRLPSEVPYLSRVKAACVLMNVGAVRPREVGQDAIEATMAAMQTGEAFEANAYADALSMYSH